MTWKRKKPDMKRFKENDKSQALCEECGKIVTTTFRKADFTFKNKLHKDILQGFCDRCGGVVSLPHQSIKDIKRQSK